MKLRECLEKIQEKKYENVSLWAKTILLVGTWCKQRHLMDYMFIG